MATSMNAAAKRPALRARVLSHLRTPEVMEVGGGGLVVASVGVMAPTIARYYTLELVAAPGFAMDGKPLVATATPRRRNLRVEYAQTNKSCPYYLNGTGTSTGHRGR